MYTLLLCNKNIGYPAHLKENEHLFHYRAQLEGNFFLCVRPCTYFRALINDAKIVCSRQGCAM